MEVNIQISIIPILCMNLGSYYTCSFHHVASPFSRAPGFGCSFQLVMSHTYSPNCSMASLPVYSSAEMIPSAANMAKRPLLISRSLVG